MLIELSVVQPQAETRNPGTGIARGTQWRPMCEAAEQPVSKPFDQTAQVAFGDVVIDESHLEDVFFATELNKRDTAEFVLRRAPDLPGPIDFFARVEVRMTWAGGTDVPFAGHVIEANAEGDRVRVRCASAVQCTVRRFT